MPSKNKVADEKTLALKAPILKKDFNLGASQQTLGPACFALEPIHHMKLLSPNSCSVSMECIISLLIYIWISKILVWKIKFDKQFVAYFKLDFYCLCRLQKSILKSSSINLIFQTRNFKIQAQINRENASQMKENFGDGCLM